MKTNSNELLKNMRNEIGISQAEMAEHLHVSERHLQRVESGKASIDIWQFMAMLEILGQPTEDFWLLYLDTKEYEEYRIYRRIKRLLQDREYEKIREILPKFEEGLLSEQFFIRQFIARVKLVMDKDTPHEQILEKLYEAIKMSKPDFAESKIVEYRLTYNEVGIIIEIAGRFAKIGNRDKSIELTKALVENRENLRASDEDKAALLPALLSNLSTMLGKAGRYKESLKICEKALEVCREYHRFRFIPNILHNIASGHKCLGEEEQIYKPHLIRAYHCAYAMGYNDVALRIKEDAEEDFGIILT